MLEVWGRRNSSNVIPVMWAVGELGLEHVRHNVGGSFGGLDTPEFGAMNPNHLVPMLRDDDGFVVWESHVIIRYLCRKYGAGSYYPDDAKQLTVADQWMEWCGTTAFPAVFPIFWGLVRTAADKRDMAAIEKQIGVAATTLKLLDEQLAGQAFVAGDTLTIADIPLGAVAYRYFNLMIDRPSFPNIEAWYQRLCERSAFQTHVMIPFGTSPEEWAALEKQGAE